MELGELTSISVRALLQSLNLLQNLPLLALDGLKKSVVSNSLAAAKQSQFIIEGEGRSRLHGSAARRALTSTCGAKTGWRKAEYEADSSLKLRNPNQLIVAWNGSPIREFQVALCSLTHSPQLSHPEAPASPP